MSINIQGYSVSNLLLAGLNNAEISRQEIIDFILKCGLVPTEEVVDFIDETYSRWHADNDELFTESEDPEYEGIVPLDYHDD